MESLDDIRLWARAVRRTRVEDITQAARVLMRLPSRHTMMYWSADRIRRFQDEHLPRVVRETYMSVCCYKERFDAAGIHPDDIRNASDLPRLPAFPKLDYRQRPVSDRLSHGTVPDGAKAVSTSGTSGIPLFLHLAKGEVADRYTDWWLAQQTSGMSLFAKRLFVGALSTFATGGFLSPWRKRCGIHDAIDTIDRYRPAVLVGYPSQLRLLLDAYREANLLPPPIQLIYSGGELADKPLKDAIRAFFHARVVDLYGTCELGVMTVPCPEGGFHTFNPRHMLECVDESGAPVPSGEEGQLLFTDLSERAMPLIRYAVGDRVIFPATPCGCSTDYPRFIIARARQDDYLHAADGRRVAGMHFGVPLTCESVRRFRITERAQGDILIEAICKNNTLEPEVKAQVEREYMRLLGPIRMEWRILLDLPPHPSGKERRIVSMVREPTG